MCFGQRLSDDSPRATNGRPTRPAEETARGPGVPPKSKARFTLELRTVAYAAGGRATLTLPAGARRATMGGIDKPSVVNR